MANSEHIAMLQRGVKAWNAWRERSPDLQADLAEADLNGCSLAKANLAGANLSRANLGGADLTEASLVGANLNEVTLSGAALFFADLAGAILTRALLGGAFMGRANLASVDLGGAYLAAADLAGTTLSGANLTGANLTGAKLRGTDLNAADLTGANLTRAYLFDGSLKSAILTGANIFGANLSCADLSCACLIGADLARATLREADLSQANLRKATLAGADLTGANLNKAVLCNADFRSANLQKATLNAAMARDVMLWESQRAGWSIKGIVCESAFWDEEAKEQTIYSVGEFEKLYSEQTCIELFYQGGVSTFELNTLPALLHHLASLHPNSNIRLKSIEETGGGARISISVGDSDAETADKIKADAMPVYRAQLALRENEVERLRIESSVLNQQIDRLVTALLSAKTQQNIFNAPVYAPALPSGNASVVIHQTINDNTALLALLEKMIDRRADLSLAPPEASQLETELHSAKAELAKQSPDPSILSRSVGFIQKLATEALTRAAGKLGEQAVSGDWQSWLHQLSQFASHLR